MDLTSPIQFVKGVGPHRARALEKLNIHTVQDMLLHAPFRYDDFSQISPIAQVQTGETVTVHGTVMSIRNIRTRNGKNIQKCRVSDESGTIEVTWFNQPYLAETIKVGQLVSLAGKAKIFGSSLNLQSPRYEILSKETIGGQRDESDSNRELKTDNREQIHTGRLVPVYPGTADLNLRWFRNQIKLLLDLYQNELVDYLPEHIVAAEKLMPYADAIRTVHFPESEKELEHARTRLSFGELFLLQLTAQLRRNKWKDQKSNPIATDKKKLQRCIAQLPFTLTSAQQKVIHEILGDMAKSIPMNRLLQGDVGSGKTVVAGVAAYIAHTQNVNTLIMAPTEILAEQQFKSLEALLIPLGVTVSLITGSTKKSHRKVSRVTVGTHALLHAGKFENSGLIIIDEQHRFGVKQRGLLKARSKSAHITPHILTMTATPIPRTIALTLYGDLDLSVIDEMPRGRKKIKTWIVPPVKRSAAYQWIREQKVPVFIVCPFIEPSESMQTVKSAREEFDKLSTKVFPDLRLGLLHGKLSGKEKNAVLSNFATNKLDILVATPVVEVGIDIPQATIMVIETAERFGLAQLHQLRGRVGRAGQQAYCLLFATSKSAATAKRLKYMVSAHTGADLAQADLKLRGPGDMYGTAQHGFSSLKFSSSATLKLITKAKAYAHEIMREDPMLAGYTHLRTALNLGTITHINPD